MSKDITNEKDIIFGYSAGQTETRDKTNYIDIPADRKATIERVARQDAERFLLLQKLNIPFLTAKKRNSGAIPPTEAEVMDYLNGVAYFLGIHEPAEEQIYIEAFLHRCALGLPPAEA